MSPGIIGTGMDMNTISLTGSGRRNTGKGREKSTEVGMKKGENTGKDTATAIIKPGLCKEKILKETL
jgi:hypothetical protein